MKALTLTQPWASLVALGEKKIETRSWYTSYRGLIAIHAAMGFPGWCKRQCFIPPFGKALVHFGLSPDTLPRGRVLCVTEIKDCIETSEVDLDALSIEERAFGDFSSGRFAWFLGPVTKVFDPPIYAKGSLGLWEWTGYSGGNE
jgi:hypothetical protein